MSLRASLVFTTIFDPICLEDFYNNFEKFGHLDQINVYVIPDKKTPVEAFDRCKNLKKRGMHIECPSISKQETFLTKCGIPNYFIPFNSDNRRNIGYLMALESRTDFIISIDDDNYCLDDEDFFHEHAIVCNNNQKVKMIDTNTDWYNVCDQLNLDRPGTTYPRGFPYFARHKAELTTIMDKTVDIHMNAGLWLMDPDVDGISWLVSPAHSKSFKGESLVFGDTTWSPINTQNTAFRREVVSSYYFVKMGYPLSRMPIDRYGDIFSGYFSQACVRKMGGAIRVGSPIVNHKRNSHNYMNDAANEWACIVTLEDLLPWLTEIKLEGNTYQEVYNSLSYAIEDAVEQQKGKIWTDATRGYFHQVAYYMRTWVNACCKIDG